MTENQLLREIINAYLAADSDALFSAIRIADAILDAQPTEHEEAAAPLVPAPAHTCWGKAEKHLINSCTAYYTHEQLIAYAKQYAAWHGSLTTPPASQEQFQQPSPQAWANETGLRQIECPSCGELAVAYDPQQPSPATPAAMAVYQSITDGYTKAQQPSELRTMLARTSPQVPDYAWQTIADYEKDAGFKVNVAFETGWRMARTMKSMFKAMADAARKDQL